MSITVICSCIINSILCKQLIISGGRGDIFCRRCLLDFFHQRNIKLYKAI